jgi:NADH-quinone oxidoreductase subunit A
MPCYSAGECTIPKPVELWSSTAWQNSFPTGAGTGIQACKPLKAALPRKVNDNCRFARRCGSRNVPGAASDKKMPELLQDYLPIVIFMGICIGLGIALMASAFIIAIRRPDPEKMSAYECGFDAFDDARMKFDVRFYLVSILFIIFDLEVAFLFPWAISLKEVGVFGFWSMMIFLGVLTIGFIYEWRKGALEWD